MINEPETVKVKHYSVKKQKSSMDKFRSYGENVKRFIELISFHRLILNRVQNIYAWLHLNKIKPIFYNQWIGPYANSVYKLLCRFICLGSSPLSATGTKRAEEWRLLVEECMAEIKEIKNHFWGEVFANCVVCATRCVGDRAASKKET